jgi:hypothetical protein
MSNETLSHKVPHTSAADSLRRFWHYIVDRPLG